MSIQDIALHLGVSRDVVKDIQKQLGRRFSRAKSKKLSHIAIDKISVRKRNRYLLALMEMKIRAVRFVGNGKGPEALESFLKRLRFSGVNVKAVAIDMSPAYISAFTNHLPDAAIFFRIFPCDQGFQWQAF